MNVNNQEFSMDNLHEMFMAMHMSDNSSSPIQIPSSNSPFSISNFSNSSPTNSNCSNSPMNNTIQQQSQNVYQEAVNRPEDVHMGENGLTAYEEQMLFLQMQDQLYQQIEDERLRLQQM
jgi:hypothetical protein